MHDLSTACHVLIRVSVPDLVNFVVCVLIARSEIVATAV